MSKRQREVAVEMLGLQMCTDLTGETGQRFDGSKAAFSFSTIPHFSFCLYQRPPTGMMTRMQV